MLVFILPLSSGGLFEREGLIILANLRIELSDCGERTSDEVSDAHLVIEARFFLNCLPDPNYFFVARPGLTRCL